jgi:hypothetical protein
MKNFISYKMNSVRVLRAKLYKFYKKNEYADKINISLILT